MAEELATSLAAILAAYLGAGFVFALVFAWKGAARIDPAAEHGTLGFRILILPGAAVLWPWLLQRWWKGTQAEERNPHRTAARAVRRAEEHR